MSSVRYGLARLGKVVDGRVKLEFLSSAVRRGFFIGPETSWEEEVSRSLLSDDWGKVDAMRGLINQKGGRDRCVLVKVIDKKDVFLDGG